MIVFLIGMPACGKSRIGRLLSKKLSIGFIDLDKLIISSEQKTIAQIFAANGENYFREVETKNLKEISEKKENVIVSVGGGAPCFNSNIQTMLTKGKVFYLNPPIETLVQRVQKNSKRPMFIGLSEDEIKQKLHELLLVREKFYSQAHHIINTYRKSDNTIIDEIISLS